MRRSLQCQFIIQHILRIHAPDTIHSTDMIFFSMMDTATQVDGVLIIRPLRDAELECIETMSAMLANIITPIVVVLLNAEIICFSGPGLLQWDLNLDMLCRRLDQDCIAFIQPHSWEKFKFDQEKRVLATANNTKFIIHVFRRCLRLSHFMTRLRSFHFWARQPNVCDKVGKDNWLRHNQEATSYEFMEHSIYNSQEWPDANLHLFRPGEPSQQRMIE